MPIVTARHIFNKPIDELWAILGDFGDVAKWSGHPKESCVQDGKGIGALRTLRPGDGREIVDRLEAQTDFSYSYSIVTSPLPYKSYFATMSVAAIDDEATEFTWSGEFEPKGISHDEAIAFTENMYAMGIGLMRKTLGQ